MKVIFVRDVARVGQTGQVKEVADGYALNFLIARGLAVQATSDAIKKHAAKVQKDWEAKEKEHAALATLIQSVEGARVEMKARATEKGGLFKSITAPDIIKALGKPVPVEMVQLHKPIKAVGEYQIKIRSAGAESHILVAVQAAE